MKRDNIYANPVEEIIDFRFDETVVNVFPDMIKRSVPGYSTILSQIPIFAREYAQPNSRCYDLGCSLGATTLMLQQGINAPDCHIIAVDNSPAMIEGCQRILAHHRPHKESTTTELLCTDIETLNIENASIVTLNFTLQFIPVEHRRKMIEKIFLGLNPGGILILSEKVSFSPRSCNQWMIERHHDFKKQNGYSELEISQKRNALENIMITEPLERHLSRLSEAGFKETYPWFQCYNFTSIFAHKQ